MGVFRAFKNALAQYPETEKLWYAYKEREMKREVVSWYNSLRESWGLEQIGEEPEDIAGLALEDFRFREGTATDIPAAEELHRACLGDYSRQLVGECADGEPADGAELFTGMGDWAFPGDISFVAETASGEFAGYASAARVDALLRICAIEVKPEYRGLGLGKTLLSRIVEHAGKGLIIDLPAGQDHFSRALVREFFQPCVQRYYRGGKR